MLSPAYKRYALATVTIVYAINLLDRGLMAMLVQPIKEDLHLTDTQVGFAMGIAFGLFYATLGVPIARWADRGNRVAITSLAIGLWGIALMAYAVVGNFLQLVIVRMISAVGDSGCKPPIYSLLGDYFPGPAERTRAMYVFELSVPIASLVSFVGAGWLNELVGWKLAFLIVGTPGLLLALLVKLTLVEPRTRGGMDSRNVETAPPLKLVLSTLWQRPSCRQLIVGLILVFTIGNGLGSWTTAFMMRSHGMGTGELGIWMGFSSLISIAGLMIGNYVVNRWFADDERGQMRMAALAIASGFPCSVALLTLPDGHLALLAPLPYALVSSAFLTPPFVLLQRLVPDHMRATVLMVVLLLANLIGMGVGPQLAGVLSDLLTPAFGNEALRYALLLVSFGSLWASFHLWAVGDTIKADLSAAAQYITPFEQTSSQPCPNRAS
jgi:MFS family permease